jgi:uncharacterized 2Fe-2S/4Fe-4S cluster protein (DUF4445 family)
LAAPVALGQADVRELQLAKGAIAAGIRILAEAWGADLNSISRVYLAGAFGNCVNRYSARRIGLLPFSEDKVVPAGNTALLGAKLALLRHPAQNIAFEDLRKRVAHVPLQADPNFQEIFVEEMGFPTGEPRPQLCMSESQ